MYSLLTISSLGAIGLSTAFTIPTIIPRADNASLPPYTLPRFDINPVARAAAITYKRDNFLYGPPIGGGPFFPSGSLGNATAADDFASLQDDVAALSLDSNADEAAAIAGTAQYGGLQSLENFTALYDGEWTKSAPMGPAPGMLTNFTQDLLFSMERLSVNPYAIRRLDPESEPIPFTPAGGIAEKLSSMSVEALYRTGRLFYVDHSSQKNLTRTNKTAAACDALFYIHPNDTLLPLAIRTNVGSNLIYTPLDAPDDWLLAKIMFNVNDFWMGQWYHFANTHAVVEIVYEAAIRTLSDDHPVLAILKRLSFQAFAIRQRAELTLFAPGTAIDQFYPFTGAAAKQYATDVYESGAGKFVSNYFEANLEARGLLNSKTGPPLKHFPFYEDASVINKQLKAFMTEFVASYYSSPRLLVEDSELQAWMREAGPASIINFPPAPLTTMATLVGMLTHVAFLVSVSHHVVNTNALLTASSTLPFHPTAMYQPIPAAKGVTDVVPFLPPLQNALAQIFVGANFARLEFTGTNRTLIHMFDDATLLSRMNNATRYAAATFKSAMADFSKVVSNRVFDSAGLCLGMPFVWTALDPNVAPFSLAV